MGIYTDSSAVREYSGTQPEMLDQTSEELDALIERWILQAEELVNRYTRTSWETGEVPEGIKDATERIVANKLAQARLYRRAGVIRTDNYGQREETPMPSTRIFTQAIKDDLNLYRVLDTPTEDTDSVGTIILEGALARDGVEAPDTFGDWASMAGQYPNVSEEQKP